MKLTTAVALALVLAAPLAFAKDKKKNNKDVPALFNSARYVYVQAEDGDIMNPRLFPEDRDAISDVEDEIQNWNRYAVVLRQSEAELVMVVRRGRLAAVQAHGGVGIGNGPERGGSYPGDRNPADPNGRGGGVSTEIGGRAEAGPPDDMLRVYSVNPDGSRGAILWTGSMQDGLSAPQMLLIKQLKQQVEHAYPPQTASQNTQKP